MSKSTGFGRWVENVRAGLERRHAAPSATPARDALVPRPRPYLEPLEPRILLSADVGLVPDALLAPPTDNFDPHVLIEPEIHDEVLVREPSRFEDIVGTLDIRSDNGMGGRPDNVSNGSSSNSFPNAPNSPSAPNVSTNSNGVDAETTFELDGQSSPETDVLGQTVVEPGSAADLLRSRLWQADWAEQTTLQSNQASQVVVIDGRIPEVSSLLEALLAETLDSQAEADASQGDVSSSSSDSLNVFETNDEGTPKSAVWLGEGEGRVEFLSREPGTRSAEALAEELERRGIAVVVVDAQRDGIDQLAEIARAYQGIGAMHVVSHGARGRLTLGNSRITSETLRQRSDSLATLRDALGSDGDLLLYGCEVASGEVGIEFVSTLAEVTGVDIAASSDLTGATAQGGDWDLEVSIGTIEATALNAPQFNGLLVDFALEDPASDPDVTVSLGFDASLGASGEGLWVLTSTGGAFLDEASVPQTRIEFATTDDTIRVTTTGGNDLLTLTSVDPIFAGQIIFDSGVGDDTLQISPDLPLGLDGFSGTIELRGGDGADAYLFSESAAAIGDVTVIEGAIPSAVGEADRIDYGGDPDRFVSGTITIEDTTGAANADVIEQVENLGLRNAVVAELIDGLGAFADWAGRLDAQGDLATALAGLRGNADVGVGSALDLGEAFDQLAIEIAAYQAAVERGEESPLTAESLRALLEGFQKRDIEHLDRSISGGVVGTSFGNATDGFGLTIQLDDGEVFSLGLAARTDVEAEQRFLVFGVRLTEQGDPDRALTFTRQGNGDATVRRSSGDWKTDGFRQGQTIDIDAMFGDGDQSGAFEIEAISGDGRLLTLIDADAGQAVFDALAGDDDERSSSLVTVAAARTIFDANSSSAAGAVDWKALGFRTGQTIEVILDPLTGVPTTSVYTIERLSEDGRVLTVEETLSSEIRNARVTGKAILAVGDTDVTTGSLPALVKALNAAIDESDLSGQVRAIATDLDGNGDPTRSTRLVFQVLDSEIEDLAIEWTAGPIVELGFETASLSRSNLSSELKGLGSLDVRIGAGYRLSTFTSETSSLTPITLVNTSIPAPNSELFAGAGAATLLFEADSDGLGKLTRGAGSWNDLVAVGQTITITHDPVSPSADPRPNDGTFRVVSINSGSDEMVLERLLAVTESTSTPGEGTILRTSGSWLVEGFEPGQTIEVARTVDVGGLATEITRIFSIAGVTANELQITGSDFTDVGGFVSVDSIRAVDAVALEFDPDTGLLTLDFAYLANRSSAFSVDLGDAAVAKGLLLDASASVDLESKLTSRLRISLDLDSQPGFAIEVNGFSVSAETSASDSVDNDPERNLKAGTTANIGFLGAEIAPTGGSLSIAAQLDLAGGWGPFTTTELEAETADNDALARRVLDLDRVRESFRLDLPIVVRPGLDLVGTGDTFSVDDLGVFTSATTLFAENAFDGVEALQDEAPDGNTVFHNFAEVESFANIDAQGFIRLLGEIRTGLQRVSQSELISGFDLPFVTGALDTVFDLADAFGDALLYDDGDDGLDRDDDTFLITDLNQILADQGLADFVEFRVVDLEATDTEGDRTFELFAIDSSVTGVEIAIAAGDEFFGFVAGSAQRGEEGEAPEITGFSAFTPTNGRLTTDQRAEITVTRTTGSSQATVSVSVAETSSNSKVGNDVAKLLDANNAATFDTAQELKAKLVNLAVDALGVDGLAYDSAANLLTYEIDLTNDLFQEEFSVDFDLDLGPLGDIRTVGDPTITIGGRVGFNIKFGIDLSATPNGQAGIEENTNLTELRGVDNVDDLIKTNPAITARNLAGVVDTANEDLEITLDRVRMSGNPDLVFNASETLDVSADTLVNNLVYLVAPEDFEIVLDVDGTLSSTGFQQASLRVPARGAPTVEDDGRLTFTTPGLDFGVRLDRIGGPVTVTGEFFQVLLAAQTYTVSSERVFKSRWLSDIERAIKQAQNDRSANSITRSDGQTWAADGFAQGQIIEITGSESNNGFYEIKSGADSDTLELVQDLEAGAMNSNRDPIPETGIQIEGPGTVGVSTDGAFDEVEAGELIQISGSLRNDGFYAVDSKSSDGRTLTLSVTLDPEPTSSNIELVGSGVSLRLDPTNDGDARFVLQLNGRPFEIFLPAEASADDPFAPNTSDNETLTDLVQDLRSALSRATDLAATGDDAEVDLSNRVEVGLDGTRLVLTLKTVELGGDAGDASAIALSFTSTGPITGTITRSGADDGDDPGSWLEDGFELGQLIRLSQSDDNDGLYRIVGTDPDDETVINVRRLDRASPILPGSEEQGVEVRGAIARFDASETLDFETSGIVTRNGPGSFVAEGFEIGQIVVIERAGANSGSYRIASVGAQSLTLMDPDSGVVGLSGPDSTVSGVLLSASFRMTTINAGARALGFGSESSPDTQAASLADLIVATSDGTEILVTLDGATTIGDVLRRIEEAAGGTVLGGADLIRARVSEDGTGIELLERGQLTGTPRLTFEAAGNRILRSEGDWQDDGFSVGDTIEVSGTALNDRTDFVISAIEREDPGDPNSSATILVLGTGVSDEAFVREADIVNATRGFVLGDEDFRIQLINGSIAALGLGILRTDAALDANQDGRVDLEDRDGLIEGSTIGGSSIFDRIFIQDPTLSASLFLEPTDSEGIDVEGNFGFFESTLNANGRLVAEASITLNDPGEGVNDDGKITLREMADGLEDVFNFIDVPRFAGNSLDDSAGLIAFSNVGETGRITRQNGGWGDDDFRAGQNITLRSANGRDGDYLIDRLESSAADGRMDVLVLEERLPDGDRPDPISAAGALEIVAAMGTLVLKIEQAELGGFVDFAALGADAAVVVTLFDLGDPFFRETVGPASKAGGTVTLDATDQIRVVRAAGDASIDETLDGLREALGNREELKAEITFVVSTGGSAGDERTAFAKIIAIDADGRIRVDEDFVDDIANVTITKVLFTKPPRTEIDTPDLGNLLDFQNISFLDIIRGLQLASDFLGQFEEFGFLDDAIPVLNVSFNDLLDYSEEFAVAIEDFQRDPAASLQGLEARLEEVLGIDDGTDTSIGQDPFDIELIYATEELAGASTGETKSILRIDLILGTQFNESLGIEFDLGGEGVLAGAAGLQASGAAEIRIAMGIDISETAMRGDPALVFRQNGGAQDDEIERLDGFTWLGDGFLPGQTIKIKGTGNNDGRYDILDISNDGRTLILKDDLVASEGAEAVGVTGIEVMGSREISLFDDTAISATFNAGAEDLSFRAAVGPLGLFISEGEVDLGGRIAGEPGAPADAPQNIFRAGLDFDQLGEDGSAPIFATGVSGDAADPYQRQLLDQILDDLGGSFSAEVEGGLDVVLPVFFPTESLEKGSVEFRVGLGISSENGLTTSGSGLEFFRLGETDPVAFSELFNLSDLLDLGQFSLFDNVLLAVDGFDLFLGGLQDLLDGEIFGIDLPLIGDSLSDGARFIEDLREDFVEPFRELVEDAESFVDDQEDPDRNAISKILFDLLSSTGLLLVVRDAEGNRLAEEDIFTARKENLVADLDAELGAGQFYLRQAIQLDGTRRNEAGSFFEADGTTPVSDGEIDIAQIPTESLQDLAFLEWDFRLGQDLGFVDTDIALDFGFPALGLEADGAIGLELGWDLELGFGLNFQDGFYFDIGSASELEINIDVVLPDSLTGRLAFLQLDAINAGSGLGASFVVDVVNKDDAGDDKLSFVELGKLRLEAGLAAEARALLDLELKLNEELLANFASVFPTVLAEFEFDWGIGSRGGVTLGFEASTSDRGTITRSDGRSFITESYMVDQRIRISGTDDGVNDGSYRILEVRESEIIVEFSGSQGFEAQSGQDDVTILVDLQSLSGSVISDGLRLVEFRNVGLDLGSFISDFIQPVLGEIQKITGPIQPIIEILTAPIPIISDLGPPVTLLDLARSTGFLNPALIEAIADIITLVNAIPTDVSNIIIPFGSFTIFDRSDEEMMAFDPTDPDTDLSGARDRASGDGRSIEDKLDEESRSDPSKRESTSFVKKLANTKGFKFPILTDPSQIFGLLTGEEVVLFGYDMAPLEFDFTFSASYPVYGPLAVGVFGTAAGKIDFAFGFDSSGLERFFETDFKNPGLIFDGFFVSDNPEDVTGAGPDLPELQFDLEFGLSAGLELGFARAGVAGALGAEIDFDLFDPDGDGKIRIGEIIENIENEFLFGTPALAPLALFDVSGIVTARAFAFLEINLLLFSVDLEFNITPKITLADFDVQFTRVPKLATELDDGTLQLNMGDFSEMRLNGDLRDGSERFDVDSVSGGIRVTWLDSNPGGPDFTQVYRGNFTKILAQAGAGNDLIDVSGVNQAGIRFELDGGEGDDQIFAGTGRADQSSELRGGDGSDRIVGSDGNDLIFGGAGRDIILGRAGDDVIFADEGRLVESRARVRNAPLVLTAASGTTGPTIERLDGESFLMAGFAVGQILEIEDSDSGSEGVYRIAAVEDDLITLDATDVFAPQEGGPIPVSGDSTPSESIEILAVGSEYLGAYQAIAGVSDGDDAVAGGLGNDWIFGAGGADLLVGGVVVDASMLTDGQQLERLFDLLNGGASGGVDGASDAGGADLLIGDGGRIRLDRNGSIREVADTGRGFIFGNDRLFGSGGGDVLYGGQGDDELRGGTGNDEIFGERGFDEIFGDAGNDRLFGGRDGDVIDGGANADTIEGGQGADLIRGGSGNDLIFGQAGADTIFGETGNDEIDGGSDGDILFGGDDNDTLDGGAGSDVIFGDSGGADFTTVETILSADLITRLREAATNFEGDLESAGLAGSGEDRITIRGGDDFADGQARTDRYTVDYKGGENSARVSVFDSGTDENDTDRLDINGTAGADQFLLRAGIGEESLAFVASINRGDDLERVDYDDLEILVVNGLFGDDRFAVDDVRTATTLNGDGGDDIFQVGQLYRSRRDAANANIAFEDEFPTTETTRGFLSNGISRSAVINGGNDNDTIVVYRNLAALQVNGQDGDDSIEVRAFALVNPEDRFQDETLISGGGGADTIRYAVNAPVSIDGGDGLDSVSVIGTEFADEFVITKDGVFGAGLNVTFVNIEFLTVDGAEGDDSFFIQSTSEEILTQIVGGLGSDTFQLADGAARNVISNDLLGHSGLIINDVDSNDPVFLGPEGTGIAANGISANIGDADEPGIVISESNGFTRIGEGGFIDWYTIVLTRRPDDDVFVKAIAPIGGREAAARGEESFGVFSAGANESDGSATTLVFDSSNWDIPQTVYVMAYSAGDLTGNAALDEILSMPRDPAFDYDFDDSALEGERFAVIQHSVTSLSTTREGLIGSFDDAIRDEDGDIVTRVMLAEDLGTSQNLEGRLFAVTDPPAGTRLGGKGQALLIKSAETVGGVTQLTLFGLFDEADPPLVESVYKIDFYDNLQLRNLAVQIDDNDAADVILRETEELRVFERSADQGGGIVSYAEYEVILSRDPRESGDVATDVVVELTVTSPNGEPTQLFLTPNEPTTLSGPIEDMFAPFRLVFSSDEGATNAWNIPQRVYVIAVDDSAREGLHRGLINHTVTSAADVDVIENVAGESIDLSDQDDVASFVLLANLPVQYRGSVKGAPTDTTLESFADGRFTVLDFKRALDAGEVSDLVLRITRGPGAGQIRTITAIDDDGVITVDEAWATRPDEMSRFSISQASVDLIDEDGLRETLSADRYLVNGSSVVFLDVDGNVEEREASRVEVSYGVFDRGYDGRIEERLSVQVVDNDTATVLILESDFSTDVIEDATGNGAPDTYQVVLSRPPGLADPLSNDPPSGTPAFVQVIVEAAPTVTSRGDLVQATLVDGELVGNVQLELAADQASAPGSFIDAEGRLVLVFTADNWNVPQTVQVRARTDNTVDGGDTKAFAPRPSTLIDLQGPLLVDGAGGDGSLEGLAPPVLLAGETNVARKLGDVLGATDSSITVDTATLVTELGLTGADELAAYLAGRSVEIVNGPAIDQFRMVAGVEVLGAETRIDIEPDWGIFPDAPEDMDLEDGITPVAEYRITNQSPNFFVDENTQQDVLFVHDEDSPADSSGRMTTLDFEDFPTMESVFNGTLQPGDEGYLQPTRLIGFGMGPDTTIARGLRPGGVSYSNFEGLEFDLGYGNNTLSIDAVHQPDGDRETFTRIRTGRGDDTVLIDLDEPEDGQLGRSQVFVDTGYGDDFVDASASTLGLQLVGSFGDDELIGGQGNDLIYGDFGTVDFAVDLEVDADTRAADRGSVARNSVESLEPGVGGNDRIDGQGGDDRLFGGAGSDTLLGGDGQDILFGDYGRVTRASSVRTVIETTQLFAGEADSLNGQRGNDFLFGGAAGDVLFGTFNEDLIIGEYARLNVVNGVASSIVRLAQGDLDLAASSFFGLYNPRFAPILGLPPLAQTAVGGSLPSRPVVDLSEEPSRSMSDGDAHRSGQVREIVEGDSLWALAERHLGDPYRWNEILELNRNTISDPNLIVPGQNVEMPIDASSEAPRPDATAEVANLRDILGALDAQSLAESEAGWRFSNPLAVGAGPPKPKAEGDGKDKTELDGAEVPESPEDGASLGTGSDESEMSAAVWSALVGWRATNGRAMRMGDRTSGIAKKITNKTLSLPNEKGRWLHFDGSAGRFS